MLVRDVACAALPDSAETYGQATALAGDHLGEPAEFRTIEGQRNTVALIVYARRALRDGDHFHPRTVKMWHDYHEQALRRAERIRLELEFPERREPDEEARERFIEAFYINAFADHFLLDAFAVGHMGFNRGATRPTAAMTYHDKHNARGRRLRDRTGEEFWMHGDKALHWKFDGKPKLLAAASTSVLDLLVTIVTGKRHAALERHASDRLPIAYLDSDEMPIEKLDELGRKGGAQQRMQGKWVPLAAMHDPANVTYAPGIEYRHALALSSKDYERDQLTLLTSIPFDKAWGFRADLGVGMGTSPFRGDSSASLHQRAGLTFPLYAAYSSVLGYDLGIGGVVEECIAACNRTSSDDQIDERGLATGYLAFRVNVEAGKLVLLQAFIEGLLGADFGGDTVGGLGFGIVVGKPVRTSEPAEYSGPPI
jgi:hypothetical protein